MSEDAGQTVIYVAKNHNLWGMVGFESEVREDLGSILARLRQNGVKEIHLISGDTSKVVRSLAEPLGFDGFADSLLPEEKAQYVERLSAPGHTVAVIGDGVNDALALSKASVGIAMGAGGSEAAVAAADIALADDDLRKLIFVRKLSQQTRRVIQQNFWLAVTTDLVGAGLGVWGLLSPVLGGLMHVSHALVISANSAQMLTWQPPAREKQSN